MPRARTSVSGSTPRTASSASRSVSLRERMVHREGAARRPPRGDRREAGGVGDAPAEDVGPRTRADVSSSPPSASTAPRRPCVTARPGLRRARYAADNGVGGA